MRYANKLMPRSFRKRLLIVYLAGMLLSAALVGLAVQVFSGPFDRHTLQSGVLDFAEGISGRVVFNAAGRPVGLDESKIERWLFTSLSEEVVLRILDRQGRVVYSPNGETNPLSPNGERFDASNQGFRLLNNGVQMHAATVPLSHNGTLWYVQLALSDRFVLKLRHSLLTPALGRGILAMCLTFLVVFLIATHVTLKHMFKPLRAMSEEAQRITPQTMDGRLQAEGVPSELAPLVQAFNSALDRLQQGFRTQQEFLANAAHELKTPLALIRAQVELSELHIQQPYLIQDVDRMARQVQQLLLLAEASEVRNYRIEALDPSPLFREVCDYLHRAADSAGVQICLAIEGDTTQWRADRGALFTLLKNLLENAIQHSPPNGAVTMTVHSGGFAVKDQGPGVTPEQLKMLFVRFWRGESRRDEGAGLGLSICQEIVTAHGWRMEAHQGDKGLQIQVSFVASADTGVAPHHSAAAPLKTQAFK